MSHGQVGVLRRAELLKPFRFVGLFPFLYGSLFYLYVCTLTEARRFGWHDTNWLANIPWITYHLIYAAVAAWVFVVGYLSLRQTVVVAESLPRHRLSPFSKRLSPTMRVSPRSKHDCRD